MKHVFLSIILCIAGALAAGAQSAATQADSAYNQGHFELAEELYQQAATNQGVSAQLYFNLGNTNYRLGRLGKAVVYYERALMMDPSMADARTNLDFVNTKILDKPEDDSTFLGNLHRSVTSWLSPNGWAWLAFVLFAAVLGCVALYIFSSAVMLRKTGFFGGFVLLIAFAYTLAIAAQTSSAPFSHMRAVVIQPTANLSTTPGSTADGTKIIPVHEGTVLEIVDSMAVPGSPVWYDVKINNSTRAWVSASDIEKI